MELVVDGFGAGTGVGGVIIFFCEVELSRNWLDEP
jgi:hypothetical protein